MTSGWMQPRAGTAVVSDPIPPTVEWTGSSVRFLDQRHLPEDVSFVEAESVDELCDAIETLVVRGAPALGVTGAMGIALAAVTGTDRDLAARRIVGTRPTAVNLRWGVEQALAAPDPVEAALTVLHEDVRVNRAIGSKGVSLLKDRTHVMTHCNTGSLACAGYGTALGVIRAAHEEGRDLAVWATETRPVLQGSRLTAWELDRLGIPVTVVADSAAASIMAKGAVDCVIVGADRIAANGDVANKIGTYTLAVVAAAHEVPFYVAAPTSTIDVACRSGDEMTVEERSSEEISLLGDRRVVPPGVAVHNPAFDITPARLVSAIVTELGVAHQPYGPALAGLVSS